LGFRIWKKRSSKTRRATQERVQFRVRPMTLECREYVLIQRLKPAFKRTTTKTRNAKSKLTHCMSAVAFSTKGMATMRKPCVVPSLTCWGAYCIWRKSAYMFKLTTSVGWRYSRGKKVNEDDRFLFTIVQTRNCFSQAYLDPYVHGWNLRVANSKKLDRCACLMQRHISRLVLDLDSHILTIEQRSEKLACGSKTVGARW